MGGLLFGGGMLFGVKFFCCPSPIAGEILHNCTQIFCPLTPLAIRDVVARSHDYQLFQFPLTSFNKKTWLVMRDEIKPQIIFPWMLYGVGRPQLAGGAAAASMAQSRPGATKAAGDTCTTSPPNQQSNTKLKMQKNRRWKNLVSLSATNNNRRSSIHDPSTWSNFCCHFIENACENSG